MKKKVLFLAHDNYSGGSGRCLLEFLSQLKPEDGIEPIVLTRNNNGLKKAFVDKGIKTYTCRFGATSIRKNHSKFFWGRIYRPIMNFIAYHYIKHVVNLKKIDVIYSNSKIIDLGAYLHRKMELPHIWHLREFGDLDFSLLSFEPNLHKYIRKNATKAIAVSQLIKKHFEKDIEDDNFVTCIYDGVVGKNFSYTNANFCSDVLRICFVGTICEAKGQRLAIEALLKITPANRKKIQLCIFGDGSSRAFLEKFVCDFNLREQVVFKGYCSDVAKELQNYDVGLNLSKCEGFGRTTVEYMLSGLYVIGSNSGATPEILDNGKYGTLIPYGDVSALAKEFENIIKNKEIYKKKAQEGREFALKKFCIENNYKKIVDIINSI